MTVLSGHRSMVNSVAFSADGHWLVSGSRDHTVRLWSVKERREVAVLSGHMSWVESVAFSADSQWLASGSGDKTVRLWSVKKRGEVAVLSGHAKKVTSVAFSADGQWLASGSWDKTVRLWSVTERCEVAVLSGHTDSVSSVAFSADCQWLASGSSDYTVRLWSVEDWHEVAELFGYGLYVHSVAFSANGQWLASGSDGTVRLWFGPGRRRELAVLSGHTDRVYSVAFNCDGLLASAGDRAICVWAPITSGTHDAWQLIWRISRYPTFVASGAFIQNAQLSEENKQLLLQYGATADAAPVYGNNPHTFWRRRRLVSIKDFAQAVRDCVQALQSELPTSYDANAAASFTATWLRAVRKGTLEALEQQPKDYGIPEAVMDFINDYAPQHNVLYGGMVLSDYSRRLEKRMNRGEFVPTEFNAQVEPIDTPSQRRGGCLVM